MKKIKYGNMITVLDALTFVDFYQHTDHWNRGDGTVLDRIMEKVEYADVVVANKVYIFIYIYIYSTATFYIDVCFRTFVNTYMWQMKLQLRRPKDPLSSSV
jgi:hypothetical protein